MSDPLLTRLATMEAEIASLRARPAPAAAPQSQFDAVAFKRAFVADPYGVLRQMGASPQELQHIERVSVAHAMGDAAPAELKMLASMGPQISNTNALASDVAALRRQLDERDQREATQAVRASLQTLVTDKSKYPHLSAAYAADPTLFQSDVDGHKGNATDLATALEAREAKRAAIYQPKPAAQTTPSEEAVDDNTSNASTNVKPAVAGALGGDSPPITQPSAGVFTPEDNAKLKAEILLKYNLTE